MRSILRMPSDELPPSEGEGALPERGGRQCEAF